MTDHLEFEWSPEKEADNIKKHGLSFRTAMEVFADPKAIHLEDSEHSLHEARRYVVGRIFKGDIVTVRYTWRGNIVRIFGAARWRKWKKYYEKNSGSE